jgi:chaperonin GroES
VQFKAVQPVGDRVLVKIDKQEAKSIGGVLLPTAAQSRPTAGAIVATGDVNLVKVRLIIYVPTNDYRSVVLSCT